MSSIRRLKDSISNLRGAVNKLNDALAIQNDRELVVEGTIQRFEYVVELLWKTIRRGLIYERVTLRPDTPREVMRQGFVIGWLDGEVTWQELLDKRNKTSHEYLDEDFIDEYYNDIKRLTPEIIKILEFLETNYH